MFWKWPQPIFINRSSGVIPAFLKEVESLRNVHSIEFRNGSKEELLPEFYPDFPHIASYVELDKYPDRFVPWHWHKEIELFYMETGALEYYTPKGKHVFSEGSGGLVNSNILHMTQPLPGVDNTIQILHLFDASLIGGQHGSRIEQRYITPLLTAASVDLIPLYPNIPGHMEIIDLIRASFRYSSDEFAYEIRLRSSLSDIWCRIFELAAPMFKEKGANDKSNERLKSMMIYIHEHYAEKITIREIASAAFISERECYRAFHDCLHMTPVEYLNSYRLQRACYMLANSQETVTSICHMCGLGGSSYFGKIFRERIGCTPLEYRQKWQDNHINRQN